MSRVTVLCASSKMYWPLMELTALNRVQYCSRHKYDLSLRVFPDVQGDFHIEREIFMLEELSKSDWLFFMGVDTCFTNFNIKILDILKKTTPDITYGMCKEGTAGIAGLNNDVLLLRNTERTVKFLQDVMSLKDTFKYDQDAMSFLLSPEQLAVSGLIANPLPQKILNAMPQWLYGYDPSLKVNGIWDGQWEPGDFIFHAPGLPLHIREYLIAQTLASVIK